MKVLFNFQPDASKFKKAAAPKDDDDDESDDSYWTESDESSSSSDNDPGVSLIEKFLKKKGPAGAKDDDVRSPKLLCLVVSRVAYDCGLGFESCGI